MLNKTIMEIYLHDILPENMAQAICYTLLHSLWQGMIAALLTGLIMLITKKSGANLRYHLLSIVLFLFFGAFAFTLASELSNGTAASSPTYGPNSFNWTLKYLYEHAAVIAFLWLLLVLLNILRLLLSIYTQERFRTKKVKFATAYWTGKLNELAKRIGVSKTVALLDSGLAKAPLMIGYLKPVILLPAGLINRLAPEEVEAILLHELAHIKRNDYLVNFLQRLIEILLFFNPALLWLSALIRQERENCCDDLAVGAAPNKLVYVRAMVHFQEQSFGVPRRSLAFGGRSNGFILRIERIVAGANRSLNKLEVIGLSLLLMLSLLFIAVRPRPGYRALIKTETNGQFEAKKKAEAEASRRTPIHP